MTGTFTPIWPTVWKEVFLEAFNNDPDSGESIIIPEDIYCELVESVSGLLREPALYDIRDLISRNFGLCKDSFKGFLISLGIDLSLVQWEAAFDDRVNQSDYSEVREQFIQVSKSITGDEQRCRNSIDAYFETLFADRSFWLVEYEARWTDIQNDPEKSLEYLTAMNGNDFRDDLAICDFLQISSSTLQEVSGPIAATRFENIVKEFVLKYNLAYTIEPDFSISRSLSYFFQAILARMRRICQADPDLNMLLVDFDETLSHLRQHQTERQFRLCLQKQFLLLEGIAQKHPDSTSDTLGKICDNISDWPHSRLREVVQCLYQFSNKYPGIRHPGDASSRRRDLEIGDLSALTVALTAMSFYLTDRSDTLNIYVGN